MRSREGSDSKSEQQNVIPLAVQRAMGRQGMLPVIPTVLMSDVASIVNTIRISYCPEWGRILVLCVAATRCALCIR